MRKQRRRKISPPPAIVPPSSKAAVLPPYQAVLVFMASFSSAVGDRRAAEGYVLELCSEICAADC